MIKLDIENIEWEFSEPCKMLGRKVVNLEESILSCILQKPELINELIITEKDFYQYPKQFKFFVEFYNKFKCLDLVLMVNKIRVSDRRKFVEVVDKLIDFEPSISCFRLYQEALLEYNNENKKELLDKQTKNKILSIIMELNNFNVALTKWFEEIEKIKGEYEEKLNDY